MMRGLGLAIVFVSVACGDNAEPVNNTLLSHIRAQSITAGVDEAMRRWPNGASEIAIAALADDAIIAATLNRTPGEFDDKCKTCPNGTDCGATCPRSEIEVLIQRAGELPESPIGIARIYPPDVQNRVESLDVVVLDNAHVGVAWLECNTAPCDSTHQAQSCTARYARVDLISGEVAPPVELYRDKFGDLQLTFDPATRQLLATVAKPAVTHAGVFFAIFDEHGTSFGNESDPLLPIGSDTASMPAAIATPDGFLVVADDATPHGSVRELPCTNACECTAEGTPHPENGGLYAFRPGLEFEPEHIASGALDGHYGRRDAVTAIVAGERAMVVSRSKLAEVFVPEDDGWRREFWSTAPLPAWVGALGDGEHVAWLGSEQAGPSTRSLVAGVLVDSRDERGALTEPFEGELIDAAPLTTAKGVMTTFVMHGRRDTNGRWHRIHIVRVHADWQDPKGKPPLPSPTPMPP